MVILWGSLSLPCLLSLSHWDVLVFLTAWQIENRKLFCTAKKYWNKCFLICKHLSISLHSSWTHTLLAVTHHLVSDIKNGRSETSHWYQKWNSGNSINFDFLVPDGDRDCDLHSFLFWFLSCFMQKYCFVRFRVSVFHFQLSC